MREGMR